MLTEFILLFLVAIFAGFFGALVGIGGGVIIVPVLTLLFQLPIHMAIAASIVSVIATSIAGARSYVDQQITNVRLGMFLEISTTTGAQVSALAFDPNGPKGPSIFAGAEVHPPQILVDGAGGERASSAIDSGGVFLSTNNGTTWDKVDSGLTKSPVSVFAVSGLNLFAGTDSGIFLSTNDGTSWTAVNNGLVDAEVNALAVEDTNLIAGIYNGGTWIRSLSDMPTPVENHTSSLPVRFVLSQNYPNPFNPSTIISYQIPSNAHVVLKVFDVLGREVETLVDQRQNAGNHSVRFNASGLPTGVYFYRLEAGPYHDVKKLLVLK